jgi:flavin reductase (DIM6/NTAB) family NADH-FMN oxidoreductase RutF
MAVDRDVFRSVMGCFAAGVTVVTTVDADGAPYGLTATAFSSVSLDPPLALVCIGKESGSYSQFAACRFFAVNFLAEEQTDLSQHFASSGGDKFARLPWARGEYGVPILGGTIGFAECRLVHSYEGGDHTIFVGEIEAGAVSEGSPLTYFRGAYRRLTEL